MVESRRDTVLLCTPRRLLSSVTLSSGFSALKAHSTSSARRADITCRGSAIAVSKVRQAISLSTRPPYHRRRERPCLPASTERRNQPTSVLQDTRSGCHVVNIIGRHC